ncbi:hypothetical protein [Blastopirellula marina]|uniref:HEAT repeat domain-containing protein n=1 Tax=Blastopirellula marina TaxID=124 RepID=A0A2S8GK79_9BACT|nr:hypothetical protein [Blastopirellula marina]PQO44836.1 hypothetical protein C5Y93_17230 [Blastopirellula marina]
MRLLRRISRTWRATWRTFDGYDDWEEIVWGIDNVGFYQVFEEQAKSLTGADDTVYHDAVPRLIVMLDDEEPLRRQNAWRLLQCASESPRFAAYEEEYRRSVVALLHHPSVRAYNKFLPWLVEQKLSTPEVLAGLRERMMGNDDAYAPQAAYTLAELVPTVDIAPRLLELIEQKHPRWESILHRLPNYLPADEAERVFEANRPGR